MKVGDETHHRPCREEPCIILQKYIQPWFVSCWSIGVLWVKVGGEKSNERLLNYFT